MGIGGGGRGGRGRRGGGQQRCDDSFSRMHP